MLQSCHCCCWWCWW